MKKIINGKMYNTETAQEIACYCNDLSKGDFRYYDEMLYRKKTGEFFLSGEGGPMSKYSRPCGNMTGAGSGIIPISIDEAKSWIEQYSGTAVYIEVFGEPEE